MTFKDTVITLCIQARIAHKEAIEAFAVNTKRAERTKIPEYRFMPEDNEMVGDMFDIAKPITTEILRTLFTSFEDKIILDLKGHCRQKEAGTLKQYNDKYRFSRFSIERIIQTISLRLTGAIFNIPVTATINEPYEGVSWDDVLSECFELLDYETDNLLILGRENFACNDCGESINVQLDMETATIGLFDTKNFI
jgi:hypothetical protein